MKPNVHDIAEPLQQMQMTLQGMMQIAGTESYANVPPV
jgi:hypothetical protein